MRPLVDFAGYADLLPAGPPLEHYQAFMAELDSSRAESNAVAFWSDAMARVDKARVWGAFASARSQLPQGSDAQLIGLEIDVLNAGLPGVFPNQAKVGLQIVGFGATNSNAIEILPQSAESGRFMNLFMADANAVAEDGTIFGIAPQTASTGLNLLGSRFKDAAVLLSPDAAIAFRSDGNGDARIYRDSIGAGHLVMNSGPEGFRITDVADSRNLLNLSPTGWIRSDSQIFKNYAPVVYGFAAALALSLTLNVFALVGLRRVIRSRS